MLVHGHEGPRKLRQVNDKSGASSVECLHLVLTVDGLVLNAEHVNPVCSDLFVVVHTYAEKVNKWLQRLKKSRPRRS